MAKRKTGSDSGINMQDLARAGAEARLEALRAEQAALLAAFPDLRGSSSGQTRAAQARTSQGAAPARPVRQTPRRHVSRAAQGRWRAHAGLLGGAACGEVGRGKRTIGRR